MRNTPQYEEYRENILREAQEAQMLWENQLLRKILSEMKDRIYEQWRSSKPEEAELRELCYMKLRILDEIANAIFEKIAAAKLLEQSDQAVKAVT